ncbi:MAG: hypothetical protein GY934_24510 [Gammaproteobacteria bacterium]|nr:hypothetical protein [Gammaproteobacteria bacterium]
MAIITKKIHLVALICLIPFIAAISAYGTVPAVIDYQGRLEDGSGDAINGTQSIRFFLYTVESGGTSIWDEQKSITVTDGMFEAKIGSDTPFAGTEFENSELYLEIQLLNGASWETLSTRQAITSTAYAMKAGNADMVGGETLAGLDSLFLNEGQVDAVTSAMIQTGAVNSSDIANNSLTATDLATNSVGSSELATNSVDSAEVKDNSLTSADLAANSVGASEIATGAVGASEINWSLSHSDTDINGGLLHLTNSSNSTTGNYPMGIAGQVTGAAGETPVIGVFGGAPGLGLGSPMSIFPDVAIGVGGSSSTGYGVAGVSSYTSGRGIYGYASNSSNYTNYGGYFQADGAYGRGVYATSSGASGYGVYATATGTNSSNGVYGYSSNGDGIYGSTGASNEHGGYFNNSDSVGLSGAALLARAYNSDGNGIAFHAHNDHTTSTDATAVLSNDGTGPLLKGFGGDGGEDEFRFNNDGTLYIFGAGGLASPSLTFEPVEDPNGGAIKLRNSSGAITIELDAGYGGPDGRIITDELQITGGSDLSEQFDIWNKEIEIKPGMVVSIDPENPGQLQVSDTAYDNKVAGIISGAGGIKPGMLMGQKGTEADGLHPVALTGRVYCWADASTEPIQPGDLLTTSTTPGHAMKVTEHSQANGAILGKAMTALKENSGLVLVLVSLQ